jgi:tetratricopeptide (TPR) repeat protein
LLVVHDLPAASDEETGDAYYAKAFRAVQNRDYDTALEACEKAVELGCSKAYQAYALNMMGTFTFLKGNTTAALEYFDKAIEADPKYVQSLIKRSSIYMEQGRVKAGMLVNIPSINLLFMKVTSKTHSSNSSLLLPLTPVIPTFTITEAKVKQITHK